MRQHACLAAMSRAMDFSAISFGEIEINAESGLKRAEGAASMVPELQVHLLNVPVALDLRRCYDG